MPRIGSCPIGSPITWPPAAQDTLVPLNPLHFHALPLISAAFQQVGDRAEITAIAEVLGEPVGEKVLAVAADYGVRTDVLG